MGRHGNCRADAERNRREDRGADDRPVDEVVERVAHEHQRRRGAVHPALVGVAVPQQHQLLENEEDENAGQQRAEDHGRRHERECLGQEREERDAEQRADGVTDQPRHDSAAQGIGEEQQPGDEHDAAEAPQQAEAERCRQQRHATF